jgi:hypothetical protein
MKDVVESNLPPERLLPLDRLPLPFSDGGWTPIYEDPTQFDQLMEER